jgi:hypothetical protein
MKDPISRFACLTALAILSAAGCTSAQEAQVQHGPAATPHVLAGGCAGTVLTEAEPPAWAQGGWTHATGTPWGVPWALGTGGDAVAFVFANELVAGGSPRIDGTNNKVLWVAKGSPTNFVVEGIPPGGTQAVVTVNGGPSIVDVPSPGCWRFHLTWGDGAGSTINLTVLPAGSTPPAQAS